MIGKLDVGRSMEAAHQTYWGYSRVFDGERP
jgi:hypothetical protein